MDTTSEPDWRKLLRVPVASGDVRAAVDDADVAVVGVGPTGVSALDPLVTATDGGRTAFFPACPPERASAVAEALADGTVEESLEPTTVVEHEPDETSLPAGPTGLDVGARRVLGGCGWRPPDDPAAHETAGGFVDAEVEAILATADGLLGRGWGDWRHDEPVGDDWRRMGERGDAPVVVVNAHGTVADALLCESAPFELLEGADLAARAVGADSVVVYLSEGDERAVDRVRAAAAAYPDPSAPVDVVTGPAVYRAAEPTMALEAIEGNHRLEARLRPPGGDAPTLHQTPALVHTARTLAQLAVGVRNGQAPATRLVTVSGDVEAPATVELPEDETLDDAVDAVTVEDGVKAACVGGRFGGLTDSFDVALDPGSLGAADLGTEGTVELLGNDRCVLEFVGRRTRFAADTNCGRCVPCREGSTQLADKLRDVYDGDYDETGIEELVRVMDASSVCEFGVNAGRPARTALDAFGDEVAAHANGRCPVGACSDPAEVTH